MRPDPPRYRSYLLRCWEERSRFPDGPVVWRFSLQDPRTGEHHGFADLEALIAAIQQALAGDAGEPPAETPR